MDFRRSSRKLPGRIIGKWIPWTTWAVCVFVTPGRVSGLQRSGSRSADYLRPQLSVCRFTAGIRKYSEGVTLVTVETRQVPTDCWPSELKCRSRMHYYLAAREAQRQVSGATALLLDHQGCVSETPTANAIAFFANPDLSRRHAKVFFPASASTMSCNWLTSSGVPFEFRDLTPAELATADEILLTSTPFCLLPVVRFDERHFCGQDRCIANSYTLGPKRSTSILLHRPSDSHVDTKNDRDKRSVGLRLQVLFGCYHAIGVGVQFTKLVDRFLRPRIREFRHRNLSVAVLISLQKPISVAAREQSPAIALPESESDNSSFPQAQVPHAVTTAQIGRRTHCHGCFRLQTRTRTTAA